MVIPLFVCHRLMNNLYEKAPVIAQDAFLILLVGMHRVEIKNDPVSLISRFLAVLELGTFERRNLY